jgi:hypothetical protein
MKKIASSLLFIPLAMVILINFTTVAQKRGRVTSMIHCVTTKQVEEAILLLEPFQHPSNYLLTDDRYSDHRITDVQRNYPIAYLFFKKGFIRLEENGTHTFSDFTSKGRELVKNYPQGIPFSSQTLLSISNVKCIGKNAVVEITLIPKPTEIAIKLLGSTITQAECVTVPQKKKIKLFYTSGKWQVGENVWLSLISHIT